MTKLAVLFLTFFVFLMMVPICRADSTTNCRKGLDGGMVCDTHEKSYVMESDRMVQRANEDSRNAGNKLFDALRYKQQADALQQQQMAVLQQQQIAQQQVEVHKAEEQIHSVQEETKSSLKAISQVEPQMISNEEMVKKLAKVCQSLEKADGLAALANNAYYVGVIREKREQYHLVNFEREALIEDVAKGIILYKSTDKELEDFRKFLVDNLPDFLSAIKTQNLYWSKRMNSGIVLDESILSSAMAKENLIGEKIDAYQTETFAPLFEMKYPDFLKLFPEKMTHRQGYKKLSEFNNDGMVGIRADSVDGKLVITFVEIDSPAEKAGLMAGDVLTKVNGVDTPRRIDYLRQGGLLKTGSKIPIEIKRGLETKSFEIKTMSRKEYEEKLQKQTHRALAEIHKR